MRAFLSLLLSLADSLSQPGGPREGGRFAALCLGFALFSTAGAAHAHIFEGAGAPALVRASPEADAYRAATATAGLLMGEDEKGERHPLGTAFLALSGRLAVTAAHNIFDERGALKHPRLFFYPDIERHRFRAVEADLAPALLDRFVGQRGGYDAAPDPRMEDDWAILVLEKDVVETFFRDGYRYALIVGADERTSHPPAGEDADDYLVVGYPSAGFSGFEKVWARRCGPRRSDDHPRYGGNPLVVLHDCAMTAGSSGAPIFRGHARQDGRFSGAVAYMNLFQSYDPGFTGTGEDLPKPKRFDPTRRYNGAILIGGPFRDALARACLFVEGRSCLLPAAGKAQPEAR